MAFRQRYHSIPIKFTPAASYSKHVAQLHLLNTPLWREFIFIPMKPTKCSPVSQCCSLWEARMSGYEACHTTLMWILGKLSCKWTAASLRLALIRLSEAPVWGEGRRGSRYLHCSFLNIISQVGLGSGSSIPAANGKIKGLCRVWSQRVEAANWTPRSGFHAMSVILSAPHQSRAAEGTRAVIRYLRTNWPFNSVSDLCSLQWLWTDWVAERHHCIKALCRGMPYCSPVKKLPTPLRWA